MAKKKSRKVGQIGIPKVNTPRTKPRVATTPTKAKPKAGRKPGSRQNIQQSSSDTVKKQNQDPRLGSKTPINLDKYKAGVPKQETVKKEKIKYHSPKQELEAIESNKKLEMLLEKQESGSLTEDETKYVEKLTARYAELCDLMGIDPDDYADDTEIQSEDDPFSKLDAIKLDDFKD